MTNLFLSFASGFVVSFIGSIIPSNMSVTAMELTLHNNKAAGLLFGLGSAIVEIVYIRLYFLGFSFFVKGDRFKILEWTMLSIFLIAGIVMIVRSYKKRNVIIKGKGYKASGIKALLLGITLKALNPSQFVFWAFWSTYLVSYKLLIADPIHYSIFCVGIGLATFSGFVIYVFLGKFLESKPYFTKEKFDRIAGAFLVISSIAWAIKLLWVPANS